jgi:predicted O-methyltransferase YrrM
MKKIIIKLSKIIDLILSPFVFFSSLTLKIVRKIGVHRMYFSKIILDRVGLFPIIAHYHEPLFKSDQLSSIIGPKRNLPGINFNIDKQIEFLQQFSYTDEFKTFLNKDFYFGNGSFENGDAEYLYNFIRVKKPNKIIEVGCGFSTLIIQNAIKKNFDENNIKTEHICIEPYENEHLSNFDLTFKKLKIEKVNLDFFKTLSENDFLFIDSSHIIRPNGDVLYEFLEILPTLNRGVYVHVHDIFTPYDYPKDWILEKVRFWNEQYLLEAFLTNNNEWEIIGSLYYLKRNHFGILQRYCKYVQNENSPGSIYLKKI